MKSFNCFNLIFSSSATVYQPGEYVNEEVPFSPSNPYGETKIAVEYMLRSLAKSSKEWRLITLRYFNPVGAT
jgi:UDP-glucose 4-epimerase